MPQNEYAEYAFNWWWEAFTRDAARRVKLGATATWICRYEQEAGSGITQIILMLLNDIKAYPETARFSLVPDFLNSWDNFFKEDARYGMPKHEFILLIKEQLKEIIQKQSNDRIERHASE